MGSLTTNYYEATAIILFGIGFTTLLLQKNMIKKIIGLNIMDTSIFLFLAAKGYIAGAKAPIANPEVTEYINPLPSGLVLTGIVVAVTMTAFLLALSLRIYQYFGTLDTDRIVFLLREEREEANT